MPFPQVWQADLTPLRPHGNKKAARRACKALRSLPGIMLLRPKQESFAMSSFVGRRLRLPTRTYPAAACAMLLFAPAAWCQEAVSLTEPAKAWTFDNGREFPGATGALTLDATAQRGGRDSLKLVGDFSRGGNYVQAGRKIDNVDIREL